MFPETHFLLIDRTGKKVKVAQAVAQSIGLQNVECRQCDVAEVKERFDFVVSRAVMELPALVALVRKNIKPECINSIPNGLICLKGGDLTAELQRVKTETIVDNLNRYFEEKFFDTKKVIYVVL